VQCVMEIGPLLGISCGVDGKQLLGLLTSLDKKTLSRGLDYSFQTWHEK
jgi:hypothetical protein